jgi:hypothetical protein
MPPQVDREKTRKNIRLLLEKLKAGGDLQRISEYRSLFKKEVPLFRRSWVAGYLLLLHDPDALSRALSRIEKKEKKRPRKSGGAGKSFAGGEGGSGQSWQPLAEEESTQLFISAGRNRRVSPRDILGLIIAKAPVSREDIGVIRILDNYSFIQVRDRVADRIIEALDGQPFRGRTLAVNYARTRKEAEEYTEAAAGPQTDEYSEAAADNPAEEYTETTAGGPEEDGELPEQDEDHPDEKEI